MTTATHPSTALSLPATGGAARWAYRINLVVLSLLGGSTGAVKLAQMPEEIAIFANIGFSTAATIAFGAAQLLAAVLLWPAATRRVAAGALLGSFVFATYVLFANAVHPFSVLSILFFGLCAAPLIKRPTS